MIHRITMDRWVVPGLKISHDNTVGSLMWVEMEALISLAVRLQPKRILEFGTFRGRTAYCLARNTEAHVWTVDLPQGRRAASSANSERKWEGELYFEGTPEEARVTRILADSKTLTVDSLPAMDFIFVDGGHDKETVRHDSELAFALLRPGGMIVWHDYRNSITPELTSYLDSLNCDLAWIRETRLVCTLSSLGPDLINSH